MRILFACSEAYPLIKTGGLADVSYSLPLALTELGHDVVVILPFFREIKDKKPNVELIFNGKVFGYEGKVKVLRTQLPEHSSLQIWLVDAPDLFDREGGPYTDAYNHAWEDSAYMFATFARVAAMAGNDHLNLKWKPDVVHCNDWQTGLAIPLLHLEKESPASVFTIHNLAYQGKFSREEFEHLLLPEDWWSIEGIEFHGECSFLKAGINFADWITTVSPNYAEEIKTVEFGERFEGLLQHHQDRLVGILNGVDYKKWNPKTDPHIDAHFSTDDLSGKDINKEALQKQMGLDINLNVPLFGMVCRLVHQKGVDLLLEVLVKILHQNIQVVVLGNGDVYYEAELKHLQAKHPEKLAVHIGYDEHLSHRIEAGSDFFLMPSRFEPCGLNQLYSLRYGTLPIVRKTGGLADSVSDSSNDKQSADRTGLVFDKASSDALFDAMERALSVYQHKAHFHQMRINAMAQDFSWTHSCKEYIRIYQLALDKRNVRKNNPIKKENEKAVKKQKS